MKAFQVFWRKDGHLAAERFSYREAGPHLMLMGRPHLRTGSRSDDRRLLVIPPTDRQ
jgi:hypothetical protein